MGASIAVYWPGISNEQFDGEPGFRQDKVWANWLPAAVNSWRVRREFKKVGVSPLLTFKTEGVDDEHVDWVTPNELESSARKLIAVVKEDPKAVRVALQLYEKHGRPEPPVEVSFVCDIEDIIASADYARTLGQEKLTFEVNW